MVMTLPALMMMMEVLWSQIGKRMRSLYFVKWIVMTMDQNMIEALPCGMCMRNTFSWL